MDAPFLDELEGVIGSLQRLLDRGRLQLCPDDGQKNGQDNVFVVDAEQDTNQDYEPGKTGTQEALDVGDLIDFETPEVEVWAAAVAAQEKTDRGTDVKNVARRKKRIQPKSKKWKNVVKEEGTWGNSWKIDFEMSSKKQWALPQGYSIHTAFKRKGKEAVWDAVHSIGKRAAMPEPIPQHHKSSSCAFCGGRHYSDSCLEFRDAPRRKIEMQRRQICRMCLIKPEGHSRCQRWKKPCKYCISAFPIVSPERSHHPALCTLPELAFVWKKQLKEQAEGSS